MTDSVHEAWFADCCLTFDGRVVEVFDGVGASSRFHIRQFGYEVKDPDRSGGRWLQAGLLGKRGRLTGGVSIQVSAADWPGVERVLQAIDAARPGG